MATERATLNYAAAVISTASSAVGVGAVLLQHGPRDKVARAAMVSAFLGLVGTIAWLLAARSDHLEVKRST